jgi:hypothetical protein
LGFPAPCTDTYGLGTGGAATFCEEYAATDIQLTFNSERRLTFAVSLCTRVRRTALHLARLHPFSHGSGALGTQRSAELGKGNRSAPSSLTRRRLGSPVRISPLPY